MENEPPHLPPTTARVAAAVDALAAVVAASTRGPPASAKLRATAVSVLSRGGVAPDGRWRQVRERGGEAARRGKAGGPMRDAGERGAEERQAAGSGLRIVIRARGRGAGAPRAARGGPGPSSYAPLSSRRTPTPRPTPSPRARPAGTASWPWWTGCGCKGREREGGKGWLRGRSKRARGRPPAPRPSFSIPHLDEFLIALQGIASSPAVLAALRDDGAPRSPPLSASDASGAAASPPASPVRARSPTPPASPPPPLAGPVGPLYGRPAVAGAGSDPAWFFDRPHLAGWPFPDASRARQPAPSLASMPPDAAERAVVGDLLTALLGVSATWAVAHRTLDEHGAPGCEFRLAPGAPGGVAAQAGRLLPLAAAAADVARFAHAWSATAAGGAAQGAASAAGTALAEWRAHVARIDHARATARGALPLASLALHTAGPAPALLETAAAARAAAAAGVTGGRLVDLLASRAAAAAGDAPRAAAAARLLAGAAAPLFAGLTAFVADGVLPPGPACELPFVEDASVGCDDAACDGRAALWSARLTLARAPDGSVDAPACLTPALADALTAARCLVAARAAGGAPARTLPPGEALAYDASSRFAARVADAARRASADLLALVRDPPAVAGAPPPLGARRALAAVRTFLLAARGDFVHALLDALGEPFGSSCAADVRPAALPAALDAALRVAGLSTAPGAPSLALALDPRSVLARLRDAREAGARLATPTKGEGGRPSLAPARPPRGALRAARARDALSLTLTLPFPASILVPPSFVDAMSLLFRHTADLAVAQRALAGAWRALAPVRALRRAPSPGLAKLLNARMWMDAALSAVQGHAVDDVVEPAWRRLTAAVAAATTVDAATSAADAFVRDITVGALLCRRVRLLRSLTGVKDASARFGRAVAALADGRDGDAGCGAPAAPRLSAGGRRSSVGGLAIDAPLPLVAPFEAAADAAARADRRAAEAGRLDARAGAPDVEGVAGDAVGCFCAALADLASGAAAAAAAGGDESPGARAEIDALAKLAARLAPVVRAVEGGGGGEEEGGGEW